VAGTSLVLIGVVGGFKNRRRKFRYVPDPNDPTPLEHRKSVWNDRKNLWEDIWESVLIIGLVTDLVVVPHQLNETSRLNREAGDARKEAGQANERAGEAVRQAGQANANAAQFNERASVAEKEANLARLAAANIESNNLVLAKQVDETKTKLAKAKMSLIDLQNANLPMLDFGEVFTLAVPLVNLPKVEINLRSVADANAQRTAMALAQAFFMAGWKVNQPLFPIPYPDEGIVIRCGKSPGTEKSGRVLLELLTEKGVPAKIESIWLLDMQYPVPTNTLEITVCSRPNRLNGQLMLIQGREVWFNEAMTNPEFRRIMGLPNTNNIPNARQAEEEYSRQTAQIKATLDSFQRQEQDISNQIENAKN